MTMTYHKTETFTLYHGDNREVLKELADNSIDSIVTDPPYELGFMGKSWDASGIAFNVEVWQECLRVLKPGGHLLAFSGSRTYHRMAVAIEDAGFEMRDQIMWIYGSGFPKSHNVANAIDKYNGAGNRGHAISSGNKYHPTTGEARANGELLPKYEARTEAGKGWEGWGTALKPAHEPIVVARKPLIGTVAANVLTYGTGGLNIDGARVAYEEGGSIATNPLLRKESGAKINYGIDKTPTSFALKNEEGEMNINSSGRWPANVIHDGSDEVVELFPNTKAGVAVRGKSGGKNFGSDTPKPLLEDIGYGDSGTAARFFYCAKASKRDRNEGCEDFEIKQTVGGGGLTAAGGAYGSIKAPANNHHPTVKPTALMQYLCKLVTPPGGVVLDPFMGSGSTGKAAMYEGFKFIGIEMTDEYLPIAKARIEFALKDEGGNNA